jgi:hypothetical protein
MRALRVVALAAALASAAPARAELAYDLAAPDRAIALPAELREVSGLDAVDEHTVACVDDERGVLFLVDLRSGGVTQRRFGPDGDHEGLARVGADFWVLRSDGRLLRLARDGERLAVAAEFTLDVGHRDLEGLGFDPRRGILLVAPKDRPRGAKEEKDRRPLFGFDPESGRVLPEPVLTLSTSRVVDEARARGVALPERTTKKGKPKDPLALRLASVAVHPVTGAIHLLSAADGALLAVDREGRLLALAFLDPRRLPKPEGVAFLPGGDLVIASEGRDGGPGVVEVFRYRGEVAASP